MLDPVTIGMGLSALSSGLSAFGGSNDLDKNQDLMNIMARKQAQRGLNMYKDVSGMALPQMGSGLQANYLLSDFLGLNPSNVGSRLQKRGYGNSYGEGGGASTGQTGFLTAMYNPDQLTNDPGYQFRLEEGQKALDRQNSRIALDPRAMKEAMRYNSGLASQEYQAAFDRNRAEKSDIYNRLMGMSSHGLAAGSPYSGGGIAGNYFSPSTPNPTGAEQLGAFAGDIGSGLYSYGMDKQGQKMLGDLIKSRKS